MRYRFYAAVGADSSCLQQCCTTMQFHQMSCYLSASLKKAPGLLLTKAMLVQGSV